MLLADVSGNNNNKSQNVSKQVNTSDDKTGKKSRNLPHPKIMSYPVAVTPDENNGSRLLIKCFEYIPPDTSLSHGYQVRRSNETGVDERGVKQVKGEYVKANNNDGTLRQFPENIGLSNRGASDRIGEGQKTSHLYYIELPIPQDVNDSNTVTWGDNTMNLFQLAGIKAIEGGFTDTGETMQQAASMFTQPFLQENFSDNPTLRNSFAAAIAGRAVGATGNQIRPNTVLGRSRGEILNSNLELLFDSVNLRSFPFSVTFSPRSPREALRVKQIIRALKSSMAAKKGKNKVGQGGAFLKAPDVFHLRYLHNGKDHPFLNSFKHCALTGMSVNYTNTGTFSSYSDGTPVSIQMSMTFKELNPVYNEDYDQFDSNSKGVGF